MTIESCRATMNFTTRSRFSQGCATAALLFLTRQSVTSLSRSAFVRLLVKESILLRAAFARHRSYPGGPTQPNPALASGVYPLT